MSPIWKRDPTSEEEELQAAPPLRVTHQVQRNGSVYNSARWNKPYGPAESDCVEDGIMDYDAVRVRKWLNRGSK